MISERKSITSQIFFFFFFFPIDESYYLSTNKPCNLQLGLHLQCQLYLSSIVKYGFVRDIPGRSENAVPMVYRHARRRSLLKVAVCQPLGLRDIILARALRSSTSISLVGSIYSILLNKLGDFFIHFLLRLCRQSHWFNWRRSKAPVKSSKKEGSIPNLRKAISEQEI